MKIWKPCLGVVPLLAWTVLFLPVAPACAQDQGAADFPDVKVTPLQVQGLGNTPGHINHTSHTQDASILCGGVNYVLHYAVCIDKAHHGKVAPICDDNWLGMTSPSAANWFYQGFLNIIVDGRDIGTTPLSSMLVSESQKRAIVDMVWHDEAADVRLRFLALPQHDNLFAEIALEPKQEIKSLQLYLKCYPSYFTAYNHREGARRIQTPAALLVPDQSVTLPAKDNWWCVYYDRIFDVAKGEGDGPCGLLLLPEEVKTLTLDVGGYMIGTRITYPAAARRIRLALWDFTGKTNASVLARMKTAAPAIRQELDSMDFTPEAVTNVDLAALRADLQRAAMSPTLRQSLGPKLAEAQTALDQYVSLCGRNGPVKGIVAEEHLLQTLEKCRDVSVQVKLAELLDGL